MANLSLQHITRPAKENTAETPVLFMFHGYGSNEEDLFSFAQELSEDIYIISVQAPYQLPPYGYAWYAIEFDANGAKWSDDEQARNSRDLMANFITEACDAYSLNAENVTLLGFSQGTILSYAVALSYPEKVKNVIALSGYINKEILVSDYASKNHKDLNFYVSHGTQDQVLPIEWARNAKETLDELQIPYVFEEYPVGHGVAPQNFFSFKNWLEKLV
ncbi:phospholipase/carboxylesterase [Pustulibacterium marinum]|uniref:Phospholipase/carboxylesterase n=1 Tax=Pustulibacterium marinum TaxID=1224947 RepID=A0A1I7ICZ2_9FLAO|nr:alpha/beta fold hydrolase [Pustulibacterium marinum]SFU70819.1 phospholipase/carboxylesterase [Pustulibacterium marinum]